MQENIRYQQSLKCIIMAHQRALGACKLDRDAEVGSFLKVPDKI